MVNFRDRQRVNRRATAAILLLVLACPAALAVPTYWFFGSVGLWLAPVVIVLGLPPFFAYWFSDAVVLRATSARVLTYDDAPGLINVVDEIRIAAGLPMPRVALVDDPALSAFATGRDPQHAVVAVTTGLLNGLSSDQVTAVIAHELSHIANRDTRVMALSLVIVQALARVQGFLAALFRSKDEDGNVNDGYGVASMLMLFTPVIAFYGAAGLSRRRESLADATAVQLTRNPRGLREALERISVGPVGNDVPQTTAHLWFSQRQSWANRLAATHPPIEDRIARVRAMEGNPDPDVRAERPRARTT